MISNGEIVPGLYLSVLSYEPVISEAFSDSSGNVLTQRKTFYLNYLMGIPLKVVAVSLPFISVICKGKENAFPLDTRTVSFTELSPEYVESINR